MKHDRINSTSLTSAFALARNLWRIPVRISLGIALVASMAVGPSAIAQTAQPKTNGINFGSVAIGSTSAPTTVTFSFGTGGTIGAPVARTVGVENLDFKIAAGGTCASGNTYAGGNSCTVNVTFGPQEAGLRRGAVELVNTSGVVVGTAFVYGIGTGPEMAWNSATPAWGEGGAMGTPYDAVADENFDIFVIDHQNGGLYESPPSCGSSSCVTELATGFTGASGLALDGAGNIYVANTSADALTEVPLGCGSSSCEVALGGGFTAPQGVTVDGAGNVYVADGANVWKVPEGCTAAKYGAGSCSVTALGGTFGAADGVGVDGAGNVFVADATNEKVVEIPAGCTSVDVSKGTCSVQVMGGTYVQPTGVAVGADDLLYVSDSGNVYEIPPGCTETQYSGGSCNVGTLPRVLSQASFGIGVNGEGDIFLANTSGHDAVMIERDARVQPHYTFPNTRDGQTSSSTVIATVGNIGTSGMTFPLPSTGDNPSVSSQFAAAAGTNECVQTNTQSSTAFVLGAGQTCNFGVSFQPTAVGSINGSVVFKDDALNAAAPNYATQNVALNGTGLGIPNMALSADANPSSYGSAVTFTATVTGAGSVPTGSVTFEDNGATLGTSTLDASGVATLTTSALTGGAHSITAVYGGDSSYSTATGTLTQTVNPIATTTSVTSMQNPGTVTESVTLQCSVSTSLSVYPAGSFAGSTATFYDGATELGVGSVSAGVASFTTSSLSVGTHSITAVFSGNSNFAGSTSSALTETIEKEPSIPSIDVTPGTTEPVGTNMTFTDVLSALGMQPTGTVTFKDGTTTLGTATVSTVSNTNLLLDSNVLSHASMNGALPTGGRTTPSGWYVEATPGGRGTLVAYPSTSAAAVTGPGGEPISTGGAVISYPDTSSGGSLGSLYSGVVQAVATTALAGKVGTFSVWLQASTPATVVLYMTDTASATAVGTQTCNVGSTWTRCSVTGTFPSTSTGATVSMRSWGATAETVNAWGTQLEQASSPGVYVQTTTAAATGSGGIATFSTTSLTTGSHSITAAYSGDADFTSNTSSATGVTMTAVAPSVTLSSSATSPTYGDAVTFTATIAGSSLTPTGKVTFKDGSTTLGTGTLNSSGVATFTTSALSGGTHSITAVYGGDSNFTSTTSTTLTQTVNKALVSISAASSLNPSTHNQSVTFTTTIAPPSGVTTVPTGTVTILNNGTTIGTGALNSSGVATISTSSLPTGTDRLTVRYDGDVNFY